MWRNPFPTSGGPRAASQTLGPEGNHGPGAVRSGREGVSTGLDRRSRPLLPSRRGYPSDTTDAQWQTIRPFVLGDPNDSRRASEAAVREIVNAVNYRWRTGCSWRMLPHDFPAWQTVYGYFRRWRNSGVLSRIRAKIVSRPETQESPFREKSSDSRDCR
ncbi:MAG: transposase [Planctomycetota bacterium]|nr:MAG: transposase [Planctomycetota bacterium]REJ97924.1 MAG: transposase [Planctomycetota bacterium]REK25605.1 MAG: transposase [Planctomycetota bacterium]REK31684.1 MAG: transposase [Planctomycetota bacterium]